LKWNHSSFFLLASPYPISYLETVAKYRKPRRNRGGRGSKPQEYYLYFEDFETKPDDEFGWQPKFCNGLALPPIGRNQEEPWPPKP
jgi:hypothetical protein